MQRHWIRKTFFRCKNLPQLVSNEKQGSFRSGISAWNDLLGYNDQGVKQTLKGLALTTFIKYKFKPKLKGNDCNSTVKKPLARNRRIKRTHIVRSWIRPVYYVEEGSEKTKALCHNLGLLCRQWRVGAIRFYLELSRSITYTYIYTYTTQRGPELL